MQVVAIALENLVLLDVDFHIQVARRPAVYTRFAIAGGADAHAVIDTGRNLDFQRLGALDLAQAATGGAGVGNDPAGAVALGTGLLDAEETLLHAHLAMSCTSRTGSRRGARLGAGTMTAAALIPGGHAYRGVKAGCRLLQRDLEVIAQVRAAIDLRPTATATARGIAEDVAKDVTEGIGKSAGTAAETT